VEVNVFPKIKWNASVGYSFGNKELDRSTIINDSTGLTDVINKHTNKSGKFHGKMELYYDEKKKDFALEYKEGIDKVLTNIDDITDKVDSFLARICDGKFNDLGVKFEVFWPNISIKYEAELLEDKKSAEVINNYSLTAAADPLIGMKGSLDLFPVLLKATKSTGAGAPVAVILEAAQKGVGNDQSIASLQAEIKLVFSVDVKTAINFSTKGTNGKDNAECKSEQAISIDLQFEGLIGAKGHVWVIKFEKNYKAGIKTGFVGKIVIDRDDRGYFWYSRFLFNGLTVSFTKYEKLEKNISQDDNTFDELGESIPDQIEESTSKDYVWLEPSPDDEAPNDTTTAAGSPATQSRNKHYLIEF
jgi:hypothetical protein